MEPGSENAYERAEQFLPQNSESLVRNESIDLNWIGEGDDFWFRLDRANGTEFLRVDPKRNECVPAFNHERLASSIDNEIGCDVEPDALPFDSFEYVDDESAIRFQIDDRQYECDLSTYECEQVAEDPDSESNSSVSPNGRWVVFVEDHDLFVRDTQRQEVIQLTDDGTEHYDYATPLPSPVDMVEDGTEDIEQSVEVNWSPDSRRLVTYRLDQRSANRFTLVQSTPDDRTHPKRYTYPYPLSGEVGLPVAEPVVFDVERRTRTFLDVDPIPLLTIDSGPLFEWFDNSEKLHYLNRPRGFDAVEFLTVDAMTGASTVLVEESFDTLVDPNMSGAHVVQNGEEIVWTSERSGWHHLYLLDVSTGEVRNRITEGKWVVRNVKHIDDDDRYVYFTASGREEGRDPYLRHLYRVDFDGSDLTLLTPERADHEVDFSPSGEYFVDTYSRVDQPPVTVLRGTDSGRVIRTLAEADAEQLRDTGWEPPEPFKATAADGDTDLYGVLWRPSDFDPDEAYPVIEQIYTGPHDFHVPKTFAAYRSQAQAIAELGFVVVMVDGRGTGRRSKAFRDHSYRNLARTSVEDHKSAIRQVAEEHRYMDVSRVGIYGHSAGGYDSAQALLTSPDFYDVAVSSAGNHDHRLDKASWNECWMGYPVEDHYHEQSNVTLADQLEGELLLVHGELDENVHPAATRQLVAALVEANKDFDMLTLPNRHHDLSDSAYFIRSRWDYFVEHLHSVDPPEEYDINMYR